MNYEKHIKIMNKKKRKNDTKYEKKIEKIIRKKIENINMNNK